MNGTPEPTKKSPSERLLFLKQFLTSPRYLGSVTPSSHYLVNRLVSLSNVSESSQVVELGPGTGPFTGRLLEMLPPGGRLLSIERDPELASHLRSRLQDEKLVVVSGDAQDLARHLAENQFDPRVPLIVSGLPFTSLPSEVREGILVAVAQALLPTGDFLLYQYSNLMRKHLRRHFGSVESQWELLNIPPAACMRCRL